MAAKSGSSVTMSKSATAAASEVPFAPGVACGGGITPEEYAARREGVTASELQRCDLLDHPCNTHPSPRGSSAGQAPPDAP